MSLTFPRKFVQSQMVDNAEVRGELYLWENGHFQCVAHIRNADLHRGNSINASFALLDEKGRLLGRYGMPSAQAWYVGPKADLHAGRQYGELHGEVPPALLHKTASVALLYCRQGQEEVATGDLAALATVGSGLECCPVPG